MAWAAVSLIVVVMPLPPARSPALCPRYPQSRAEALRHLGDCLSVLGLALHPGLRHIAEDRAADGEALHQWKLRGERERGGEFVLRRVEPEHDDAAGARVVSLDRLDGVPPCRFRPEGLELPPVGIDTEIVEPLNDPRGRVVLDEADLRGDDLQQELQTVPSRGVEQPLHHRLLRRPHFVVVIRVTEAENLDHLIAGPFREPAVVRP